jgi:hypothetical protein
LGFTPLGSVTAVNLVFVSRFLVLAKNVPHNRQMGFGRLVRVKSWRVDPVNTVVYVVAEPDPDKAMDILKAAGMGHEAELEDVGRVAEPLLKALSLQPGQFSRA